MHQLRGVELHACDSGPRFTLTRRETQRSVCQDRNTKGERKQLGGDMSSPTPRATVIAVTGLRKSYGEHMVLDGIDLTVQQGTVFALLGPNGGGQATLAGHDLNTEPARIREVVGVTGQYSAVDKLLTGRENLMLMADLYRLGRARAKA